MSLSSPINCQSLPIFHYSCVAPSVPHSTLTRVKQAKREKKKKGRTPGSESAEHEREIHAVTSSCIRTGTGSEEEQLQGRSLSTGKRHTLFLCRRSNIWPRVWAHMTTAPYAEVWRIWRTCRWRFSNERANFTVLNTHSFHTERERHSSVTKSNMPNTHPKMWRQQSLSAKVRRLLKIMSNIISFSL